MLILLMFVMMIQRRVIYDVKMEPLSSHDEVKYSLLVTELSMTKEECFYDIEHTVGHLLDICC